MKNIYLLLVLAAMAGSVGAYEAGNHPDSDIIEDSLDGTDYTVQVVLEDCANPEYYVEVWNREIKYDKVCMRDECQFHLQRGNTYNVHADLICYDEQVLGTYVQDKTVTVPELEGKIPAGWRESRIDPPPGEMPLEQQFTDIKWFQEKQRIRLWLRGLFEN